MNKEKKLDDGIVEIILGSTLANLNNFNNGSLLEQILVLGGLIIFLVGIFRTIIKYKKENKKGILLFLIAMGIMVTGLFLALTYRFLFV